MALKQIDAKLFQKMFLGGALSIEARKEEINELNVFPVPDGDTGTNMTLTIMAAAKEVSQLEEPTMETLAKAISSGSLRGARGNSGVILSQLFRGFTKEVKNCTVIDVTVMAAALSKAVETAYKAVMKPKEGTILTVARGGAEKAAELAMETDDLEYFCAEILKHMEAVLEKTPDLLPVLKEAGVVDSGGQGLLVVLQGAYDVMLGKQVQFEEGTSPVKQKTSPTVSTEQIETSEIKFGYCTEFIIMLEKQYDTETEREFKSYLESLGDSIVVVSDEDIVKVHVHTNDPGLAIQRALTYGSLTKMKIDNMREEHHEKVIKEAERQAARKTEDIPQRKEEKIEVPRKPVGFVAVSIGEGMNEIFRGLGVDYLIEGGQTMNPSTEDMLTAIEQVNADTIFIFPNNSNIILAAEQAKKLTKDKQIIVIPSRTVPQGITALINYVFDKPAQENEKHMTEEMKHVKTGQITYAVRDTNIDGKEIKQGDIMGLNDKTILVVGEKPKDTAYDLLCQMIEQDDELVSIYYGKETQEEEASQLADKISKEYPQLDVEIHMGGQPIYYYIISVE